MGNQTNRVENSKTDAGAIAATDAAGLAASFRELAAQYRQAGDERSGLVAYTASQRRIYTAAELCRWAVELNLLASLPVVGDLAAFHYGDAKHPGERYRPTDTAHWLLRPAELGARGDNNFWADTQAVLTEENPTRFGGNRAFELSRAAAIANPTDAAALRGLEQRWADGQAATCCDILADRLERAAKALPDAPAALQYVFRRATGGIWELRFENESAQLPDSKGLQRIWKLLQSDERGISAAEMMGADIAENIENLSSDAGGLVADSQAVAAIEGKIKSIELEIDDTANPERKAELKDEQRQLAEQLNSMKAAAGRARNMQRTPLSKAANAVRKSVFAAIESIQGPMPNFCKYLETVKIGETCYFINPGQKWITDPAPS